MGSAADRRQDPCDDDVAVTFKIVEATTVEVPPWEGLAKVFFFITELYKMCRVAGGRTDGLERFWLMEVLGKKTKLEDFAKSWPMTDGTGDPKHQTRMERLDRALICGMWLLIEKYAKSSVHKIRKMK